MVIDGFSDKEYFYERPEMKFVFSHLKHPKTIIDVGANIGIWSMYLALNYPKSIVYSFEPANITYQYLLKNKEKNDIHNIIPQQFALGEKEAYTNLYYFTNTPGASSIEMTQANDYINEKTSIYPLDEWELKPDFIKIDVEGYEFNVLKGAVKTLQSKPIIMCEMMRKYADIFHYHPNDIIKFMASFGYKCYYLHDNKLVHITRMSDKLLATNFFFLC